MLVRLIRAVYVLTIHVAACAAGLDVEERLWTSPKGSYS